LDHLLSKDDPWKTGLSRPPGRHQGHVGTIPILDEARTPAPPEGSLRRDLFWRAGGVSPLPSRWDRGLTPLIVPPVPLRHSPHERDRPCSPIPLDRVPAQRGTIPIARRNAIDRLRLAAGRGRNFTAPPPGQSRERSSGHSDDRGLFDNSVVGHTRMTFTGV